jgi:sialic acid synthase SpsE
MWEVEQAISTISKYNDQLVIMHCVSLYPTPYDKVNLNMINVLKRSFDRPVGYSGHELGIEVPIAAVTMGATCVEKHITLDRRMKGGDHKFSLEPHELKMMVGSIRNVEKALIESEKTLLEEEVPFRQKLSKSLVAGRSLKRGNVITAETVLCKSPQTGLPPIMLGEVLGKKLNRDVEEDHIITSEDLE